MDMDLLKIETIEVGKRLQGFREQLGLSQKEFAERLNVPANYISRYESGLRLPSFDIVRKLKKTFGLNEFWLATGRKIEDVPPLTDWPVILRLVRKHIKTQNVVEVLRLIWDHNAPPLTVKLFQEKFHTSSKEAKHMLLRLLQDGIIIGVGKGTFKANPFYPFAGGIQDPEGFSERTLQLVRIYIEGDREKIARVEGMLDMADPGVAFVKKYLSELIGEKEKS
jgi:transcriptional regulator with XRE-family HTH domain